MREIVKSREYFPMSRRNTQNFITYLFDAGLQASTITTYLSGLSFYCKMLETHDFIPSFATKKLLTATRRDTGSPDSRLPISPVMIHEMIGCLPRMNVDVFDLTLFPAMYLLAFNAFLRVGEFTAKTRDDYSSMIQLNDLIELPSTSGDRLLQLSIRQFKGNVTGAPVYLLIPPSPIPSLCVHRALHEYLARRGGTPGPLFLGSSGKPITTDQFAAFLKLNLITAGYASADYKTHSFRIGACSHASTRGIPDEVIMKMGRWRSLAFLKYVRLPTRMGQPLL